MDDGFKRVDDDLRELRQHVDAQGAELSRRIEGVETRPSQRMDAHASRADTHASELSQRIDALQRVMVHFGGGITLAVLATLVSVIATRA